MIKELRGWSDLAPNPVNIFSFDWVSETYPTTTDHWEKKIGNALSAQKSYTPQKKMLASKVKERVLIW